MKQENVKSPSKAPQREEDFIIKSNIMKKLTTEEFVSKAKQIHFDKYDYSKVNYKNNRAKVCIICPKHGEFWQEPSSHIRGHGCPKCKTDKMTHSTQQFIEKARLIHGNKYKYDKTQYLNTDVKVVITCPIHGDFTQRPDSHLSGCGCPKCCSSKGEKEVRNYLESNNINYIEQYPIRVNYSIRKSGFVFVDFYLPEQNIIIEYNGEQHYKYIPYFHKGGYVKFARQQERDQFIRDYCQDLKIKLIELKEINEIKTNLDLYL